MSLFGKVLAFLNVLGVIGALALLGMYLGKQRAWEYAVLQQDLKMDGLPLDDQERDDQGNLRYEDVPQKLQQEWFPGQPVATQVGEVERVQKYVGEKIQTAPDKKRQIYLTARVLMPLAFTASQRDRLIAYQTYLRDDNTFKRLQQLFTAADAQARKPADKEKKQRVKQYDEAFRDALVTQHTDPVGPLADAFLAVKKTAPNMPVAQALDQSLDGQLTELQTQLNEAFENAKRRTPTSGGKERAPSERKRVIAHLLFCMVDMPPEEPAAGSPPAQPKVDLADNAGYKRFLNVVGLRSAITAIDDHAEVVSELAADVDRERLNDRTTFAREHQKLIEEIKAKAVTADERVALLRLKEKQLAAHAAELKRREEDVKRYTDRLEAARKDTAERLKELRGMSDALFQERLELRSANTENQKREKQIRALEEGR